MNKPRVLDFFCGVGGFSEGFRQEGFKIIGAYDNWGPAIKSHNLNHGTVAVNRDILEFDPADDDYISNIEKIPNSEVIIGSPPCVSFSMSNKAGNGDKTLGLRLIEAYFRIVAVKKFSKNSVLRYWLMENVPNVEKHLKDNYTFKDLQLTNWAELLGLKPNDIALRISGEVINSADYGVPQARKRFICGEFVGLEESITPRVLKSKQDEQDYITIKEVKENFPSPMNNKGLKVITDPNYPSVTLKKENLTDFSYDTGLYYSQWEAAKEAKVNHPFMGKMSFPENDDRPSRTITATRSISTREAIIWKSEHSNKKNGRYRLPTVREAAILMSFPITYNFVGSEGTKWRLIGNAVPPLVSKAYAKRYKKFHPFSGVIDRQKILRDDLMNNFLKYCEDNSFNNLNNPELLKYNQKKMRRKNSKFRRHPFKYGNLTVSLLNYDIDKSNKEIPYWNIVVFLGTGSNYESIKFNRGMLPLFKSECLKLDGGNKVVDIIDSKLNGKIGSSEILQKIYEGKYETKDYLNPIDLVKRIRSIITTNSNNQAISINKGDELEFVGKDNLPSRQILAMYGLLWVVNEVNKCDNF